MAVEISANTKFHSDNIIIGFAELVSIICNGQVCWELPGGGKTPSRRYAMAYAQRLDNMIRTNMEKHNRNLV